jgi:hypothetical protein
MARLNRQLFYGMLADVNFSEAFYIKGFVAGQTMDSPRPLPHGPSFPSSEEKARDRHGPGLSL